MALISIKGRREPLEMDNDRAQKVKNRWLGINGAEKAEPTEQIDLGEWAGEYGKIGAIEIPKQSVVTSPTADLEAERKAEEARFHRLTPEQKGQSTARFETTYMVKHNWQRATPEIIERARKLQVDYFRNNPQALLVPNEVYGDLLPNVKPVSPADMLAQKMTVKKSEDTPPPERKEQDLSTDIF